MNKHLVAPVSAALLLAVAGTAQAATKTATINVTASVAKNCIISAENLALGAFDGTNDLATDGDVTVRCTSGTGYSVALSTGSSGGYASRTLVGPGTSTLSYNLYTSNTYGTIWGNNAGGSGWVTGNGGGMGAANDIVHTVYARLQAANNGGPVEAGAYSDSITATITY
jgi:spore coat protein U-like protein